MVEQSSSDIKSTKTLSSLESPGRSVFLISSDPISLVWPSSFSHRFPLAYYFLLEFSRFQLAQNSTPVRPPA